MNNIYIYIYIYIYSLVYFVALSLQYSCDKKTVLSVLIFREPMAFCFLHRKKPLVLISQNWLNGKTSQKQYVDGCIGGVTKHVETTVSCEKKKHILNHSEVI